jgi:hypothetical protein
MMERKRLFRKSYKHTHLVRFLCALYFISGCAAMSGSLEPVHFNDPYEHLEIKATRPLSHEAAGITLRFKRPADGERFYKEDTVLYTQIEAGEGNRVELNDVRRDSYSQGTTEEALRIHTEMNFVEGKEKITSTLEISERGEILRFIEGSHDSKLGSFVIRDWSRSALFPEEPVRVGQSWNYYETIDVSLSSWLVKERQNKPYEIKALSTLDSFAYCRGVRCAVIKTVVVKEQSYHFRVFFKKIDLKMRTRMDEITYFDYAKGVIVAQIIKTLSQTTSIDPPLVDTSEAQSIIYFTKEAHYEE